MENNALHPNVNTIKLLGLMVLAPSVQISTLLIELEENAIFQIALKDKRFQLEDNVKTVLPTPEV